MRAPFSHLVLVLVVTAAIATPALTQNAATTDSHIVRSQDRSAIDAELDERLARDWGLQPEEWMRYRELMQGPLGVYSPNLDPLTALGIEALTDQERRRYAELQVQTEAHRTEKLLAYQRAYDDAWKRLYPSLQPVVLDHVDGVAATPMTPARLAVFVREDCPPCEERVRQLQSGGMAFDLYMVGSNHDDTRIRQWAVKVGIDPDKVRARTITLNHDAGRWLSIGMQGELPAVVHQVDGQWRRQ